VQGGYAAGMRLDLGDLVGCQPAKVRDLVGEAASLELIQSRQLLVAGGDDQLAIASRLDPALVAVVVEQPRALDAEPRLERSGRVVDAGVDDTARV
jgi:hypothetical protein